MLCYILMYMDVFVKNVVENSFVSSKSSITKQLNLNN